MKVSKWGNTLAIRLPAAVVDILDLKEGDDVEIIVADVRTFAVRKAHSAATQRSREYRLLVAG